MLLQANTILDRILQNRILTHVLFWLAILLLAPVTSLDNIQSAREAFIYRAVGLPMKIIATYFVVYYLIPQFYQKKKYLLFVIYFVLASLLFVLIYRFNNVYIAESLAGIDAPKESLWVMIQQYKITIGIYFYRVYYYTLFFIILKTFKDREVKKREIEVLEKEKAQAELNFLKAQIHPHFLFNTLNNLYALTLDKSDEAPEVVEKLSEILDYMLYQCKDPKVLVNKEIELLQNYIDLEKIRYGDRIELNFQHDVDASQTLIAPLILISIVENAFKHGVSGAIKAAVVKISLQVKNGELNFKVFNTKTSFEQKDEMNYKDGIGVKNIQRQLELVYPNQYKWKVEEAEESYDVNLWIKL